MGFDQLSSEQQRALFTEAAQKAFFAWHRNNYGVLELISLRSNAVFSVAYPKSSMAMRHILRVNWPERKPREVIDGEMQWMSALRRAGLPVPSVIRMPLPVMVDGAPEMICTLTEFLDGAEAAAADYTPTHAAAVGRAAARIHAAAASGLTRPRLDYEGLFGANSPYASDSEGEALLIPHRATLDGVTARVQGVFDRLDALSGQFGMIHGDLKPDNLLFAAPDAPRVLDFDDCGYGYTLYDLAPLLLFLKPNPAYDELKAALWEGYTALRRLADGLYGELETLVAGRFVASCRWVAAHREHPAYRGKVESILAERAARLAGFLETGAL